MKHLDELTLIRMLDEELPDERARSARAHLSACAPCLALYEALSKENEVLLEALLEADEPLPKQFPSRQGELSWLVSTMPR